MTSLRRKLLVALLAAVTAVMLVGVLATYEVARQQLDDVFDYHLRQIALSLSDRALAQAAARRAGPELDFSIQVWDEDGVRVYLSRPEAPLPEVRELGYSTVDGPGGRWRVYATALGGQVIQVGQPEKVRGDLAFQATTRSMSFLSSSGCRPTSAISENGEANRLRPTPVSRPRSRRMKR